MQKSFMTIGLIAAGVILATALTTARSRAVLRADRVSSTEQSLVREAAPFNRLVHNRADDLKLELSRLASAHSAADHAPASIESDSFDGMAWIEPSDGSTKWISQGSNIDAEWLQALPLRNLHDGDAIFIHHSVKTADGDTAIEGLLISAEFFAPGAQVVEGQGHRVALFGVLNANAFAGLVDDWVGSSRTAQIFDEKGVVLAHTNRRSVGAQLKDDGVAQAMATGKRASVSGVFDDRDGRPLVAQAERIPQTNLRISLSVPQRLLDQAIASTVQTVFWLSLFGFSLLAGLAVWVSRRLTPSQPSVSQTDLPVLSDRENSPAARAYESVTAARLQAQVEELAPREIPALTFADIEDKAKLNVKEILDRSAAIRARLNLDFVEDYSRAPAPEPRDTEPVLERVAPPADEKPAGARSFIRRPQITREGPHV